MGRAKKHRRWVKHLLREAYRLEAKESKKPCTSCAFVDPSAHIDDLQMFHKLTECLEGKASFYCHEGMAGGGPHGTAYHVPLRKDGTVATEQLTPCGGFLRWRARLWARPKEEQQQELIALQRHFCQRFLASGTPFALQLLRQGVSADDLATALQMAGERKRFIDETGY